MKKDYLNLAKLFEGIFGDHSTFYTSSSVIRVNSAFNATDSEGFPKDGDKNFNKTEEVSETETHLIKKEVWTSVDGKQRFERTSSESKSKFPEPKVTKEKLEDLLDQAIRKQEFEEACRIRDEIKKMK